MTKYTWKDIFKNSKEHPVGGGGRCSNFLFSKYRVSVVGGRQGLYGNFFDTFELAIIDEDTREFVTGELLNGVVERTGTDVYGYLELEEVVKILNYLNKKYGTQ